MKTAVLILFLFTFSITLFSQEVSGDNSYATFVEKIEVVDFDGFKPYLEKNNDTLYIINFWATWCAPCIKELPYFQRIHNDYADGKVKVLLVSLDFKRQLESRVIPFIEKNKVTAEVILLSDPDSNKWINKVDTSWSGSIPATVFRKGKRQVFFEKEFTNQELEQVVKSMMAQ